jgi:deoxyribonuclease IV
MKKEASFLFGGHMSIAGEIEQAITRGESIGCSAIQIFTKSNRQWAAKPLTQSAIDAFKETWKNSSVRSIIAHASYLINIGSVNKELEHKSLQALTAEFQRCADLTIPYLVLHPGSYTTDTPEECMARISKNIDIVLEKISHGTLLLEIMAGQGSQIGSSFEQIAQIIDQTKHKNRVGVCFDTCHAFAAGYDFTTPSRYHALWKHFDATIGIHKLKAIHCNDSQKELGSHVDRHTDIGKGKIGLKAFELLCNDPVFFDIPKVLETPRTELTDYRKNMDIIEGLLNKKTKDLLNISHY